jgi:hypothetical protein
MLPPAPFPPASAPGPGAATPAGIAAALVLELAARGITDVYTASTGTFAVISVSAGLTVWTGSRQLWCRRHCCPDLRITAARASAM